MTEDNNELPSWTTVFWTSIVTLIGFGFAAYRYMQFSGMAERGRLTRIELYIYRAAGQWGVVAAFVLMGVVGAYYTVSHLRALYKK